MKTWVILRRSAWKTDAELQEASLRSKRVAEEEMPGRVRWIRSYVVGDGAGGLGTVCVYEAESEADLREHARRAGLPADEIMPIQNLIVIEDDSVESGG